MSQLIGLNFKTRIPEFADDASIEEALKVYHYGVDNYTIEPIPNDSIEGNFRSLDTRITSVESIISGVGSGTIKTTSLFSNPNIIIPETSATIPLIIRAIASQTSSLQQWQNSSNSVIASISTSGYFATSGYVSVGSISPSSTTALNINIINPSNKGIVVRAAAGQTNNIQEWQDSLGNTISWVASDGEIYSRGSSVQSLHPLLLIG